MEKDTLMPVQYLRAFAALLVFGYHFTTSLRDGGVSAPPNVFEAGAAGVDLFFVISGFIMAKISWDAPVEPWSFMHRRLARIVPLYWAATIFVFSIALLMPHLLGSTTTDWWQLAHSLFFVAYGANAISSAPTLLIGWTLNYEVFFYVLVAICAGVFGDRRLILTSTILIGLSAFGGIVEPVNGYLDVYTQPIIVEFVIGIIAFHIWRSEEDDTMPKLRLAMFWLSLLALFLFSESNPGQWRVLVWGVPSGTLLLSSLHVIRFKSDILRLLGDWSYSIYILHVFIVMAFVKVIYPALGTFSPNYLVTAGILSVILIFASMASYQLLELPAKKLLS